MFLWPKPQGVNKLSHSVSVDRTPAAGKLAIAMSMFLVAATKNPEAIETAIADLKVPYYDLRPDLFVLPYTGTAKELAEKLGIRSGQTGSGLVVSIGGYSGRAPTDFWEWLRVNWPGE